MKKRISWLNLLTIGAAALAATSVWAGNGSGYNGPDWAPAAIPVANDREISLADVEKAVNTCLVTGNAQKGLISVAQRVAQQTYGNPMPDRIGYAEWIAETQTEIQRDGKIGVELGVTPDDFSLGHWENYVSYFFWNSGMPEAAQFCRTLSSSNSSQNSCPVSVWNAWDVKEKPQKSHQQIRFTLLPALKKYAQIETEAAFPALSYKKLIRAKLYDEWGAVTSREIVKGLRIHVPKAYAETGAHMPAINHATGGPIALTINYREYVACLKGELQQIGSAK
jgi:hypothetical protein